MRGQVLSFNIGSVGKNDHDFKVNHLTYAFFKTSRVVEPSGCMKNERTLSQSCPRLQSFGLELQIVVSVKLLLINIGHV